MSLHSFPRVAKKTPTARHPAIQICTLLFVQKNYRQKRDWWKYHLVYSLSSVDEETTDNSGNYQNHTESGR